MSETFYDPPDGWRFGFPKPFRPLKDESLEDTLLRDGYPKELMHLSRWTRFLFGGR